MNTEKQYSLSGSAGERTSLWDWSLARTRQPWPQVHASAGKRRCPYLPALRRQRGDRRDEGGGGTALGRWVPSTAEFCRELSHEKYMYWQCRRGKHAPALAPVPAMRYPKIQKSTLGNVGASRPLDPEEM